MSRLCCVGVNKGSDERVQLAYKTRRTTLSIIIQGRGVKLTKTAQKYLPNLRCFFLKKIIFRLSNQVLQKSSGTGLLEIYCQLAKHSYHLSEKINFYNLFFFLNFVKKKYAYCNKKFSFVSLMSANFRSNFNFFQPIDKNNLTTVYRVVWSHKDPQLLP